MATSRKPHLVLAGMLLLGVAGCTGDDGASSPVDACELLTAGQLGGVLAARPSDAAGRLVAAHRYVQLSRAAPTDVCEFTQVRDRYDPVERAFRVSVTAGVADEAETGRHPIDDLGDEAYFSGDATSSTIVVRRDDVRLVVELASVGRHVEPAPPEPLVTAARQALDRLPEHATVPGLAAEGSCADVDLAAVAAALGGGGRPRYSRSRSTGGGQETCSFTAESGRRADLTLLADPDGRTATAIQRQAPKLDVPGVDAYWHLGEAWMYGNGRALSIQAPADVPVPQAEPTPGLGELAGAAAKAYRVGKASPDPSPSEGTDPCALLTPEQAGRLDFSVREPVPLRVVSRAVWSYGDNVPVDTCGYDRARTVAGQRPDLEVAVAAGHYDPVAEDDRFPKDPQPLAGLGDRAYFVHDSDEAWLVVERGQEQLTLHGRLSYQDDRTAVRTRYVRAAQEALTRLPDDVEIAARAADPACAKIGAAVAAAAGGKLRYTRGVASDFAGSCTYTMTSGAAVQIGVERNLATADLRRERANATWYDTAGITAGHSTLWSPQGDLVKVFGTRSMLTISVHAPGKRAFPSEAGPAGLALAEAAEPLLQ